MVDDVGDVEAVHRAFYDAWERADIDGLCEMWVDSTDVSLILPGGEPCRGPDNIRRQLTEMVALTPGIQFLFEDLHVSVHGEVATLTCVESPLTTDAFGRTDVSEHLELSRLAVTMVFLRTPAGWRVWHHQAAPVVTHLDLGG